MAVNLIPATTEESVLAAKGNAPKFFKTVSDLTFRRRLWLKMLQMHGRIQYNADSFACVWNVEKSQPEVSQAPDGGDLDFQEHDAEDQLTIPVRGYRATDMLTEKKREMNKGPTAITNYYKEKSARLAKSVMHKLYGELYIDGEASGNLDRFHGIQSFMGDDGATVAGDKIARPSQTYAGQSTATGAEGTWDDTLGAGNQPNTTISTDWPIGKGSAEYDWLSPLLVNWGSSAWASESAKWIDNAEDVLRFARVMQTNRGAKEDNQSVPFMHMLSSDLFVDFQTYYAARTRLDIPHADSVKLGFGNLMNFEGDIVHYESDTPPGVGYGICSNQMDMFILKDKLISSEGPEWDITKMAYLYLAWTYGNLRFQPKFFSRYASYAA
jgi:hypothetical protein